MSENTSPKLIVTPARSNAARRNGARSKGPKTPQGKKTSSRNSLKHALSCTSKTPLLLPGEDAARLQAMVHAFNGYRFMAAAAGAPEAIDTLIAESWRANRAFQLENRRLHALATGGDSAAGPALVFGRAWDQFSYEPAMAAVNRHLGAARNRFRGALSQLLSGSRKTVPIRTQSQQSPA